ncbi:MAG TPA: hypothetical protein VIY48_15650 [Candidatus Paceibacterota bacterium]
MEDYGKEDREYWSVKYAEASCHEHGTEPMTYDEDTEEWYCDDCDELEVIYKYG